MNDVLSDERLRIVVAGHVDHGKSTVIGRLLADTGSLPEGKLERVKATCARNAKPFEYAFLLDALKDEQAQGITIDAARCFFRTARRHYILIDAPGHIEFLKNMVTGAAQAEAVLLVIDAHEGVQENSKRHGYLVSMLGVRQVVVAINKMDLVDYDQAAFEKVRHEYETFLSGISRRPLAVIPVSGREGVNLTERSDRTPWYDGPTLVEQIDSLSKVAPPSALPFRLPVQGVYRFTEQGDDRRIVAGTIETGCVNVGGEVVFLPSGKRSEIAGIEQFNLPPAESAGADEAVGFTLKTQVYVRPGELMCRVDEPQPASGTQFRTSLFWMGKAPMIRGKAYKMKLGAARSPVTLARVLSVLDASELSTSQSKRQVDRYDVAECVLETPKPVAFDVASAVEQTSRLVIIDNYEIAGAGIIHEAITDARTVLREHLQEREMHWEPSAISTTDRSALYRHGSKFVVFTGEPREAKERLAKQLETRLFRRNFKAYYLGMRNIVVGLDADLKVEAGVRDDHIRRLGELARIMTDSGQIFITSLAEADEYDLRTLALLNTPNDILVVNVGANHVGEYPVDLQLDVSEAAPDGVERVCGLLKEREVILEYYI